MLSISNTANFNDPSSPLIDYVNKLSTNLLQTLYVPDQRYIALFDSFESILKIYKGNDNNIINDLNYYKLIQLFYGLQIKKNENNDKDIEADGNNNNNNNTTGNADDTTKKQTASFSGDIVGFTQSNNYNLTFNFKIDTLMSDIQLYTRLNCLEIPYLPLKFPTATNSKKFSDYYYNINFENNVISNNNNFVTKSATSSEATWKPKSGVLIGTLNEHKFAVNRLAVSQDNNFFVSCSSDGTTKVFKIIIIIF